MKVILRTDITNVGRQGDVKVVADGFARNYLLPKKLAMEASEGNLKLWEREKDKLAKQREEIIAAAKELAGKIEKASFTITVKVGENGKLFGSVNTAQLAKVFEEGGFKIGRHDILLANPLKETGVYTIDIRLHPEVIAKAKVSLVAEKTAGELTEEAAPLEEAAEEPKEEAPAAENEETK